MTPEQKKVTPPGGEHVYEETGKMSSGKKSDAKENSVDGRTGTNIIFF